MSEPDQSFPTFCHISEYGELGYRNLHRLVAFSAPLNLWAPASTLVRECSQIDAKAFVSYVDHGLIRIHGREDWLTNKEFRNNHRWAQASWVTEIDDALLSIYREDEREPEPKRRVLAGPPEQGDKLAVDYLNEFPDQVTRWNRIFHSPSAKAKIPVGTFESAKRASKDGPKAVAAAILRDAINHGIAMRDSGAEAPLYLSSADRQFMKLLEESWGTGATAGDRRRLPADDMAGQLIEVLRHLDIHRGPRNLDRFLKGEGRRLMVAWLSEICRRYRYANPRDVDRIIITELRSQLDQAALANPVTEALLHPITTLGGLVGFVVSAASCVHDPSALDVLGMSAAVVQLTGGVAKQFGYAPSSYTGPQWPFLYAYNSPARRKDVEKLKYVLAEFGSAGA